VDPISDPLLLIKTSSAENRTRDLLACSQEMWPLDHRGGHTFSVTTVYVSKVTDYSVCFSPFSSVFVSEYWPDIPDRLECTSPIPYLCTIHSVLLSWKLFDPQTEELPNFCVNDRKHFLYLYHNLSGFVSVSPNWHLKRTFIREGPKELWGPETPTFYRSGAQRWRWVCHAYAAAASYWPEKFFLELISVRGSVNSRASCSWKD
jgi:hypothetical protein